MFIRLPAELHGLLLFVKSNKGILCYSTPNESAMCRLGSANFVPEAHYRACKVALPHVYGLSVLPPHPTSADAGRR